MLEGAYHFGGDLIGIDDPDASRREFRYDGQHRLIGEVDKNGNADRIVYDFAGRATGMIRKDGSQVLYDPVQTQSLLRPEDTTEASTIVPAMQLPTQPVAALVDANGNVQLRMLDKQGQLVAASDGAGSLPSIERNAENLVQVFRDGRGNVTRITYDDRGNIISVSDPIARGDSSTPLFADPVYATGRNPIQVVTADVNFDGLSDAITANQWGDSVSVLLGNGSGGFAFHQEYSVDDPRSVHLVDVNSDSLADIVTGNLNGTVSVLTANVDGTFDVPDYYAAGLAINYVELADLNNDGIVDILAADYSAQSIVTLLGSPDGSFNVVAAHTLASHPASVAAGDFNNDGNPDVVSALAFSSQLAIQLGDGDATLGPTSSVALSTPANSVQVGDVTGDGELDIVATGGGTNVSVLSGTGDGNFAPAVTYDLVSTSGSGTAPPFNSALDLVDIDRDGDLDIVVAEGIDLATVLTNDGNGGFQIADSFQTPDGSVSISATDLNLDGSPDVVVLGNDSQSVMGVLGNGDGTFAKPLQPSPEIGVGAGPASVVSTDVNGDGLMDAITADQAAETITVLIGDGMGGLTVSGAFAAGADPRSLAAGDLNNDGFVDIVTVNRSANSLSVLMGDGVGGFSLPATLPAGAGPAQVVLLDLDGDGDQDVVSAGSQGSTTEFSVLLNHGDATFAPAVNTSVGFSASSLDLADINGDGLADLAVGNAATSSNRVNVRLGNGDGTFQNGVEWRLGGSGFFPPAPSQVKLSDVTGDGLVDVVATDPSGDQLVLRPGLGDGTFDAALTLAVGFSPSSVDVGDVDADGAVDLVVANQNSDTVTVWFGQGDGTFGNRSDFMVGGGPAWIRLADFNADRNTDFVVVNQDAESVSIRLNTGVFSSRSGTTMEYDPVFSQPTRHIDEEGRSVVFDVDPINGDTLSVTQVIGSVGGSDDIVTRYTYTPEGLIDLTIDPLGRITDSDYDALGRMTRITYAVGTPDEATRQFEYDLAGNLTASIDELGHRTEFEYDPLNRVTQVTEADPDGPGTLSSPITTYSYDPHGNLIAVTDALLNTQSFIYDRHHRATQALDDQGQAVRYQYDNAGNLTAVIDRLGRETQFVYDDRNRLIEHLDQLGGREIRVYDTDDNVIVITDENRNAMTFAYDSRNRLQRTVDPLGGVISFEYDRVDNLVGVQDELFRRSEMEYDELNREISITLPDPDRDGPQAAPVSRFVYDKASNLTQTIDALSNTTTFDYDNRDRLIGRSDADPDGPAGPLLSPVAQFFFDAANRLTSMVDPLGRTTTFAYDDLNRLVMEALPDPDGLAGPEPAPRSRFDYDAEDNRVQVTDALGNITRYVYDDLYRLVQVIEPDPDGPNGPDSNPTTDLAYDAEDQLLTITDPLGRETRYQYDLLGRLRRETLPDPDGSLGPETSPIMTYTYDAVGNQTVMVDALGNTTAHEYDPLYRVTSIVEADPDGPSGPATPRITRFEFDAAHQLVALNDGLGRTTTFEYDQLGRKVLESLPDPDGPFATGSSPVMTYTYDSMDNELSMTDALGNVTRYAYDNLYRRTQTILEDPDGASRPQSNPVTTLSYDAASQVIATTDPLGRSTVYVHDDLGRVVREIHPDPDGAGPRSSPEVRYTFDLMSNQLSETDAVGNTTNYQYDALYRLVRVVEDDPDGSGPLVNPVTDFTYDIANQRISETDPLNRTTSYKYDDLGRVVRVRQPDPDGAGPLLSPETSYSYDLMNNWRSITDPLGHATQFEFDALYRMTRQVEEDLDGPGPLGSPTTEFEYDLEDNLLALTDPVGNRTRFEYDNLDRMITETIELGIGNLAARSFVYDAESNLVERTDRNGRVIRYQYDAIYRQTAEQWLDAAGVVINTIEFAFDEASQLLRTEDITTGSRYDYQYDALSRATRVDASNGGPVVSFENAYDAQSRRTQQTVTVGGVADYANHYTYDALNRLVQLNQAEQGGNALAPKRIDFTYNADDQLISIARSRDLQGGISNLVVRSTYGYDGIGRLDNLTHTNSSSTIADYDWTFDAASRLTQMISSGDGNSDFTYDNGDQLTGATHFSQSDESYSYDENGNRTTTGHVTGFYNRLNSDGVFDYEYDDEGNRTRRIDLTSGEVTEYEWDHRNRLTRVTQRDGNAGPATKWTIHRYDALNRWISREVDPDGSGPDPSLIVRFEYEGNQIVLAMNGSGAVTNRYLWGPATDQILADEQVGDDVFWPTADHLGTVRDVVDSAGNVANHIIYDAYGNVTSETSSAVDHLFGYTGRAYDESTGLQNNLNRWYDAHNGSWTSEDPIGLADDPNVYRYAGNAPTHAVDPLGLAELSVQKLQQALPYAQLAERAYTDAGMIKGDRVGDYVVKEVIPGPVGYRAVWFENTISGEGVLSFAGTEPPGVAEMLDVAAGTKIPKDAVRALRSEDTLHETVLGEWYDIITDAQQGLGGRSAQFEKAITDAADLRERYGDKLKVVGHSLGGGLAAAAALVNGVEAVVFNPAGVHVKTVERYHADLTRADELIEVYRLWADPLTSLQDRLRLMPDTVGTVYEIPTRNNGLGYWLANHGMSRLIDMMEELLKNRPRSGPSGKDC